MNHNYKTCSVADEQAGMTRRLWRNLQPSVMRRASMLMPLELYEIIHRPTNVGPVRVTPSRNKREGKYICNWRKQRRISHDRAWNYYDLGEGVRFRVAVRSGAQA